LFLNDLSDIFEAVFSKVINTYIQGTMDHIFQQYPAHKDLLIEYARRILEYEIPIYIVTTYGDLAEAVKSMAFAFVRINKEGVRLRGIDLHLPLVAWYFKELRKVLRESREPFMSIGLNPVVFWRFTVNRMGLNQKGLTKTLTKEPERFINKVKEVLEVKEYRDISELVNDAAKYIKLAIEFIQKELGITHLSIIPSQLTLIQ